LKPASTAPEQVIGYVPAGLADVAVVLQEAGVVGVPPV
jgi:hypothetical protein